MSKLIKILIPILAIAVLYFAYDQFFRDDELDEGVVSVEEGGVLENEIVSALNSANAINLDTGILNSPIYKSLVDRSQEIEEEPFGRNDPFAPIN